MLEIINSLKPFIEDCYAEIGVREYSRVIRISPPSASKQLKSFEKQGLLKVREDRGYLLFRANRESDILRDISIIYWKIQLKELVEHVNIEMNNPTIILFGSLSKLEAKKDSDIDIAVIGNHAKSKKIIINNFEKKFKRKIQLFFFNNLKEAPKELANNLINAKILSGRLE